MADALIGRFDQVLLDLDGVVYRGRTAVPGAVEAIEHIRKRKINTTFLTNNASRPPDAVIDALAHVGVHAAPSEVVTSATATATFVADAIGPDQLVLAIGGAGVHDALAEAGVRTTGTADDHPAAVVIGFGSDVGWRQLAEACIAVQHGARLIATNPDITVPSERGLVPGNGALLGVITAVTAATPTIIGKPNPAMYGLALSAGVPAARSIAVGDRLDTDIEGANQAGIVSFFVISGAHTIRDAVFAQPAARPAHIGRSLPDLLEDYPPVRIDAGTHRCGDARARVTPDALAVSGGGPLEQIAAGTSALWAAIDQDSLHPGEAHLAPLERLVKFRLD